MPRIVTCSPYSDPKDRWRILRPPASKETTVKKSRFSESQIVGVLKEHEAGTPTKELCRRHGISPATFYAWKAKFDRMEISDVAKDARARG